MRILSILLLAVFLQACNGDNDENPYHTITAIVTSSNDSTASTIRYYDASFVELNETESGSTFEKVIEAHGGLRVYLTVTANLDDGEVKAEIYNDGALWCTHTMEGSGIKTITLSGEPSLTCDLL